MLAPIVFHIALKTSVEPVKCTPARSRWVSTVSDTVTALPGTKLMTPGGSPGREDLQDVPGAGDGARSGLPHHRVAHERGRRGQVAADGREVEGRDRVHEALEGPVLELVPHAPRGDRLLGVELLRVVGVE